MSESMPNPDINNQILAAMGDEEAIQRQRDVANYLAQTPSTPDEVISVPKPHELVESANEDGKIAYEDMSYGDLLSEFGKVRTAHQEEVARVTKKGNVVHRQKTIEADPTKASDLLEAIAKKLASTELSDDGLLTVLIQIDKKVKLSDAEISTLIDDISLNKELIQAQEDITNAKEDTNDEPEPDNDEPDNSDPSPSKDGGSAVQNDVYDYENDEDENSPVLIPEIVEATPFPEPETEEPTDEEDADTSNSETLHDPRFYTADGELKPYKTASKTEIKGFSPEMNGELMRVIAEGDEERFYHLYLVAEDLLNKDDSIDDDTRHKLIAELRLLTTARRELVLKNRDEIATMKANLENSNLSKEKIDKLEKQRTFAAFVEYKRLKVEGINTKASERLTLSQRVAAKLGRNALRRSGLLKSE